MKSIAIQQALSIGWAKTKQHFWFLVGILLASWVIPNLVAVFDYIPAERQDGPFLIIVLILSLASWLLSLLFALGLVKISLVVIDEQTPRFPMLWSEYKKLLNYLVASFLYGLMIVVGLILLIIPGVYLALKYQFYNYLIVDQNMGPLAALRASGTMTRGVKWELLAVAILFSIINILGAIALGIGLLVTVPITMLAYTHIYNQLTQRMIHPEPATQSTPTSLS